MANHLRGRGDGRRYTARRMASPHLSSFRFAVTRDAAYVNEQQLNGAGPPSVFYSIFGVPDRIVDSSAAPVPIGHRNNQFHYYDQCGITLNEHHYTYQIEAINLVFDTGMADHPTLVPFTGTLSLAGLLLTAGLPERAFQGTVAWHVVHDGW